MLEPYEGKLSSTVLRGGRSGNAPLPLGAVMAETKSAAMVDKARDERLGFRIGLANRIGQREMVRVVVQRLPNTRRCSGPALALLASFVRW